MQNKFKFSVIIPIYNVEDYLEETILSVVNQTIGFIDNIEIILVNDGSPDNSKVICEKYVKLYPNNIKYIEQTNFGVSAARNNGYSYASGKYINFLDSDDKWPLDAFEKASSFFEKYVDINVLACKLEYFEAKKGFSHPLNFKFTKDKIIDILYDYNLIQMHMASCFIRKEIIDSLGIKFDTNLKFGEDSLFINKIILQDKKYGVSDSIHYLYRKRFLESSAIDTCQLNKEFYNKTLLNFHYNILKYSFKLYDTVIPYVQSLIMYDFQWRLKRPIPEGILSKNEEKEYINNLLGLLKNIDDLIILNQRNLSIEHKIFTLSFKHEINILNNLKLLKDDFYFNNLKVFSANDRNLIKISKLEIKEGNIHIEGIFNTPLKKEDYEVYISTKNKKYLISQIIEYKKREKQTVLGHFYYEKYFKIDIPYVKDEILKLSFLFVFKKEHPIPYDIGFTENCKFNDAFGQGFVKLDNNIIEYKNKQLIIRNNSKKIHLKNETNIVRNLFEINKPKLAIYRIVRFILYYLLKKEIWLISDRPDCAGDNGEAFFRYMQTIKNKNIKTYFVLDKNSKDYKRMKKIGKVLNFSSIRYRLMVLCSSKIISSQASDYVINPFNNDKKYMKDLYSFKFTFLQHGITKDDLSNWLNKLNKEIDIFVTAGIPEYDSIINGDYYYDKDVVKLTGFPRHDELIEKNNDKNITKQIAIVPTWRKSIVGCVDKNDKSIYNEHFNETNFFKFYNSLINNPRLLKCMKDNGYSGIFCLHPLFLEQNSHFQENDIFKVSKTNVNYQELFINSKLLVTDYSSVFFDFAYINKPVLYCQFDKDEFFNGHSYDKGYFDYEKDGFGEVSYDLESTIDNIINKIENDCKLEDNYKERINKFYPIERGHNSESIYKEISQL